MVRSGVIISRRSSVVPKAPKKGGLTTAKARASGAKVSAAFQKKYAEVRASRPKLGKGITVSDLMSFYFLPELKTKLSEAHITTTGKKILVCHRVAAFVNEGRKLAKNQRYVPAGHVPKPRAKKGQRKPAAKKTPSITSAAATPTPTPRPSAAQNFAAPAPRRSSTAGKASQAQSTVHSHEHKWQYEDKTKANGPFHDYDARASDLVEDAYVDWKKDPHVDVRSVKSGEWEYMVDFNSMEQQNVQHNAHTRRKIRRVTVKDGQIADTEANEIRKRVLAQRQATAAAK